MSTVRAELLATPKPLAGTRLYESRVRDKTQISGLLASPRVPHAASHPKHFNVFAATSDRLEAMTRRIEAGPGFVPWLWPAEEYAPRTPHGIRGGSVWFEVDSPGLVSHVPDPTDWTLFPWIDLYEERAAVSPLSREDIVSADICKTIFSNQKPPSVHNEHWAGVHDGNPSEVANYARILSLRVWATIVHRARMLQEIQNGRGLAFLARVPTRRDEEPKMIDPNLAEELALDLNVTVMRAPAILGAVVRRVQEYLQHASESGDWGKLELRPGATHTEIVVELKPQERMTDFEPRKRTSVRVATSAVAAK